MSIENVLSTCTKFIYMEIYNMIHSDIIRVNGPGIGWVSLNPIPVPIPDFFSFFKLVPGPYPLGFGYTRPVCFGFWVYPSDLGFFAIPTITYPTPGPLIHAWGTLHMGVFSFDS
ncbi:hypothetical protein HanRHA438_Chr12g0554131 [Helianthus annuus]|uniref:Uncharacterized protein n=1 Tax=Helianthus annuus TaxID=4232 RepID=A0A9K3HGS2_HELAN|nr:hypothetical protein HanXRQr2_Chr12g0543101 [Helianthus annuus]KAJ0862826.1 hypothetical protein HanPSC8_Chr12g0522821 [Helianthus annuus]KAJ0866642.1 hypothetical protein HanRHA438_Chr12g0554131 [Helianthus annuus]